MMRALVRAPVVGLVSLLLAAPVGVVGGTAGYAIVALFGGWEMLFYVGWGDVRVGWVCAMLVVFVAAFVATFGDLWYRWR